MKLTLFAEPSDMTIFVISVGVPSNSNENNIPEPAGIAAPENENPKIIRKKIHSHCPRGLNIVDRRIAIKLAIENLKQREILIIAGKGHEKKQIFKNKIINFDDVKIANHLINKRNAICK